MSQLNRERSREMRLVNLLNRRPRRGRVGFSIIANENRRELVMERNCLETRDREFKQQRPSLMIRNSKIDSQHSSGKYVSSFIIFCEDLREVLFFFLFIVNECFCWFLMVNLSYLFLDKKTVVSFIQ